MKHLRIGVLPGDRDLEARALSVAASIRELGCDEVEILQLSKPRITTTTGFPEISENRVARARYQVRALTQSTSDVILTRAADWPLETHPSLDVAAVLARPCSQTAILIARAGFACPSPSNPIGLPPGSKVGASSSAIACQLLARQPDLRIVPVLDNGQSDPENLTSGFFDAIVLSAAHPGIDESITTLNLSPEAVLPAACEETFALVVRRDEDASALVQHLNDDDSSRCLETERLLLSMLEPVSRTTTSCLANTVQDGSLRLSASVGWFNDDLSSAEISRVGAHGPDPQATSSACFHALSETLPEETL